MQGFPSLIQPRPVDALCLSSMIVTRTDALNLFPSIIDQCNPECQPTLKNQPSAHKPLNQFLAPLPPTPMHANAQFAPTKRNGDDSDGAHPG